MLFRGDEEKLTKLKFCTSCQLIRDEEDGETVKTRHVPRWRCKSCKERKSLSSYASQKTEEQKHLDRFLRSYHARGDKC